MAAIGNRDLKRAAQAARRFQLSASLAPGRAGTRAVRREGQALFDLLWAMGFRGDGAETAPPDFGPDLVQRAEAM